MKRRRFLSVWPAAALLLCGCDPAKPTFFAMDVTGANFGRDFRLTDADGKERTLADFRGKYVLVFFGFVLCPQVCPTVLLHAAEARRMLGADGERVQVLVITVDPERDTAELLKEYAAAFDPSFIALRGDPARTREVATEFRVYYQKVPTGSTYTVEHTALTYVFDAKGRLRLTMPHRQSAEQMAADLRLLMQAELS